MRHTQMIIAGGWFMICFALLYITLVISINHYTNGQPLLFDLVDNDFVKVYSGSLISQALLCIYALTPLLLIPSAIGLYYFFIGTNKIAMRVATHFALLGVSALTISLLLMPSLNWYLVNGLASLPAPDKTSLIITLKVLHWYIGVFVGDILGIGCLFTWFMITSCVMLQSNAISRLVGWIEFIITATGFSALILQYTGIFTTIHESTQLPLVISFWLLICGINILTMNPD